MKKLIFVLVIIIFISSCQRQVKYKVKTSTDSIKEKTEQLVDVHDTIPQYNNEPYTHEIHDYDYTAPYICPNHCPGSGSDKPGKCPVCGMDLISNPDYKDTIR